MKPHLVRWHKEYAKQGLRILDIDNGKRDSLERLQKMTEKEGLPYPVLWDKEAKNCATYGIKGYPAAFLIGVDGTVIWEGFPNPKLEHIEKLIKTELEKVKPEESKGEKKE